MEIWSEILIAVVPAIISGFIAYYKATSNAKVEIHKVEKAAETEIARIEKEYEGKIKTLQAERQEDLNYYKGVLEANNKQVENDFVNQMIGRTIEDIYNGSMNKEKLEEISKIAKEFEKSSGF